MLLLGLISCEEVNSEYEVNNALLIFHPESNGSTSISTQVMAGLKFMHGGCIIPAGFCLTKPIGNPKPEPPKPLWSISQEEDGWGSAYLVVEGELMRITPLRKAYDDDDGIVPITDNILVDPEISETLGYSEITILSGEYNINLEVENEWGEFYVPISFTIKDDIL